MLNVNQTNLSWFVKAAVSGGFDVCKVFLVLRRCRPRRVGGRGRQQQEEWTQRAPVVQEVEGAICLNHANRNDQQLFLKSNDSWSYWYFFNQYFRFYLWLFVVHLLKRRCFKTPWDSDTDGTTRDSSGSLPSSRAPRRESSALVKLF